MNKLNRFNFIAPWYDALVKLVFGDSLYVAQCYFLKSIPPDARILILGGGSGKILEPLLRLRPRAEIWYVEASSAMLELASKKVNADARIHFIHGTGADIPRGSSYHVIVTFFFLDMFSPEALGSFVEKTATHLHADGLWLVTDFINEKWWHLALLKIMYVFFFIVSGLGTFHLPDWNKVLINNRLKLRASESFFAGFIRSCLYQARI